MELILKRLFFSDDVIESRLRILQILFSTTTGLPTQSIFYWLQFNLITEHLLLVCIYYREERIEFKKSIRNENFTYPLLYANSKNQRVLVEFIR
jgi:hypothetical protein